MTSNCVFDKRNIPCLSSQLFLQYVFIFCKRFTVVYHDVFTVLLCTIWYKIKIKIEAYAYTVINRECEIYKFPDVIFTTAGTLNHEVLCARSLKCMK